MMFGFNFSIRNIFKSILGVWDFGTKGTGCVENFGVLLRIGFMVLFFFAR